MAQKAFRCELSWSASRAKEFQRCQRDYWYARYASWGWWYKDAPPDKKRIAILKNLSSLPALTGNCVHAAIARWFYLRSQGATMTAHELFDEARDLFRKGWRESTSGEWERRPSKMVHLYEHEYSIEIDKERTDATRALLEKATADFATLAELVAVRESDPEQWVTVEGCAVDELPVDPNSPGPTYKFLGTDIYAIPDFAQWEGEKLHIYDWKTGRPREADLFQLHTYALYACERWMADPESIELHAVYLGAGEVRTVPVDVATLSVVQDQVSESVRAMMEVHYDPDEDELVMGNFPASGAPEECRRCRFESICSKQ